MYTVSKGPSKIVQKTRRGLTQKLEACEVLQELTASSNHNGGSKSPSPGVGIIMQRSSSSSSSSGGQQQHHHGGGGKGYGGGRGGYMNSSPPMPVFHGGGGGPSPTSTAKHHHHHHHHRYHHRLSQEKVSPQQEELLRYVHEKWTAVEKELERGKQGGACKVTVYQEAEPNPKLRDFEPFDLESWWGKKLYKNLTGQGK